MDANGREWGGGGGRIVLLIVWFLGLMMGK
jgi:hypothetical protein